MPIFYTDFGEHLCTRLCAEVVLLGYAGHLTRSSYTEIAVRMRSYSLAEQQAHLDVASREYARRASELGVPLIIVGHSIGGYFAIGSAQAIRAAAAEETACAREAPSRGLTQDGGGAPHVVAIFPYLENAPGMYADRRFRYKYLGLTWLGRLIPLIATLVSLLIRLPRALLTAVLNKYLHFAGEGTVTLVTEQVISFGMVLNMLGLARDEVRLLAPPFDWAAVRHLSQSGKLQLLYCPNDEWAPLESMERARREGGVPGTLIEGVGHAFCTDKEHTRLVADWMVTRLAPLLGFVA